MRVLALSSQKGGSGKTTLSGHLAVQAERAGAGPVCLIDIDPQGSLADWWNEREAEMPAFAQTTVARLAADLEVLRQQGFKLAVIDTPPAITMAIQSVIAVAELIVIPTRPSPHDLRAVGATVDLCDRAGKPLIFVVNAATPKAKITYEAAVALSQHGTVAPVTVHHRTDFAASMIDGRTVMEIDPGGRSAREVTELWEYISDRLEKNFRRTVFAAPGAAPGIAQASPRPVGGFGRRVVGREGRKTGGQRAWLRWPRLTPSLTDNAAAEAADRTRTGLGNAGRRSGRREHGPAEILLEPIRNIFPQLGHFLGRAALRIDFHHRSAVDHRGGEIGAVVEGDGSDGAVLRKRDRGFIGDLGLGGRRVDDEDQRLAGAIAQIDRGADGAKVVRARTRRDHDQLGHGDDALDRH